MMQTKNKQEKKGSADMKALIDTNVILDVLCNRAGFVEDALKVFKVCEINQITGCISALSIPNIVYIMCKEPVSYTHLDVYKRQGHDKMLSFEDIVRIVRAGAGLGIRKIRLTGGEPLVRKGIVGLVRDISATPGIEEVVMTTNGTLIADYASRCV